MLLRSCSVSSPPKACTTPRAPVPPVWFSWFSLQAITPVVPLIPTFIVSSLLTCPSAPLVVSSIGIYGTPTVMGQMANSIALVAFGSTWTIMVIVAFRTQWLRYAVMFLLLVPCSVSSVSILPLVRILLVLIFLRSVIQLPLVLSLAFSKSVDLFVHYDLIFSGGGGNDESSAAANSVMHASADGDRELEGTRSSISTAEGSAGARCSSSSSSSSGSSSSSSRPESAM
ncbi:hypothetical protein Tco_1075170 [Tanacetum coccineum]